MSLHAYCDACGQRVTPLRTGILEVNLAEVYRVEAARREWDREHAPTPDNPLGMVTAAELLDTYPKGVPWHVWHKRCDPDPDEEHGHYYWFTLDRVADAAGLLHWTAHLMVKSWLSHTRWDDLIRGAADGAGKLRLAERSRRAS